MPTEPIQPDYIITTQSPAPPDYPFEAVPDEYSSTPFLPTFQERRQALFEFILRNPAPSSTVAPWFELGRLAAGGTPHEGIFIATLDYITERKDCADFALHAMLRIIYQFHGDPKVKPEIYDCLHRSLLDFKYWPDEPGSDSMCTWTENHYILFSSAAYLAGQLYPFANFSNTGETGAQKMQVHRGRILRWLNLRFFTGFSEWLSHVYYDGDITALLSLVDFAKDEEIRCRAEIVLNLLLFEIAVHQHHGVFGSSHGRSYEHTKKWAAQENTSPLTKLAFGCGIFSTESMSVIALALSRRYCIPQVIVDIADDQERPELLHRQRMGIRVDQLGWWDLKPRDFETGMHLLTLEAYSHPRTINLFTQMLDAFEWWDNGFFRPFRERRGLLKALRLFGLLPPFVSRYKRDLCRNTREEVNVYTYRTPDYMLSSAQDYRKSFGGDQQHIWQATLGPNAVCFTTHPARHQGPTPNYWAGSGSLPRVAQVKNVLIAIYRADKIPALYLTNDLDFTHAWLPRDQFEEVIEDDGWIFARYGDGYLAIFSQNPYHWQEMPGEDRNREVITPGRHNIWVCELGRRAVDGSFAEFRQRIVETPLFFAGSKVTYQSPTQGLIEFAWKGPLRVDGREIAINDYPRYASPYVQAPFPPETIHIILGDHTLDLDWLEPSHSTDCYT